MHANLPEDYKGSFCHFVGYTDTLFMLPTHAYLLCTGHRLAGLH